MTTPVRPDRLLRFGEFELDQDAGELRRNGTRVLLPDQPFRLLTVLLERPGTIATRDELRERLWGADTFVDFDHGLNAAVKRLRDALGDSAEQPRYIETVPKRGYKFVAMLDGVVAAPTEPEATPAAPGRRRLWLGAGIAVAVVVVGLVAATFWPVSREVVPRAAPSLVRLTFQDGLQTQPTWSPDGRFIAYVSDRRGNLDVWVQPVAGGEAVAITSDPADDSTPAWSPDGQHIAFRSERDGGGIYLVRALGGEERRLAAIGYRPRWSPDGRRLLCTAETGQQRQWSDKHIYVLTLDGTPPVEVLQSFSKGLVNSPSVAWHPDGERVSILGLHKTMKSGFWTLRLPDGAPVLSDGSADPIEHFSWFYFYMDVVWAPSGDGIYFTGPNKAGLDNVWRVSVDPATLGWKGQAVPLTSGAGPDRAAAMSPDGSKLAFAALHQQQRIWSFALNAKQIDGTGGEPLTPPGIFPLVFDVTRDGTRLVWVKGTQGRNFAEGPDLRVVDLATGSERVLSRTVGPWTALPQTPNWSANGKHVIYGRWPDPQREAPAKSPPGLTLIVLDARSGEERILPPLPHAAAFNLLDLSPDGSWIVIVAGTSQDTAVPMLYSIEDRPALPKPIVPLPRGMKVWGARFSPNGRWLAINAVPDSMGTSTLYVAGVSGGDPPVQITDGTAFDEMPRWSPDGESLYFVSNRATQRGNIRNVWTIRMDSKKGRPVGSPFRITTFANPAIPHVFHDIRIAGDRLVMPLVHTSGNIWMLENFR